MGEYNDVILDFFTQQLLITRASRGYSQQKMSECLRVTPRSYFDLEHGICCVSARTLVFFLVILSDEEVLQLVSKLREILNNPQSTV